MIVGALAITSLFVGCDEKTERASFEEGLKALGIPTAEEVQNQQETNKTTIKGISDPYWLPYETTDGKVVCTLFLTAKAANMTGMPGLYKISNGKVKNFVDNERLVSDKNYKYYKDYKSDEVSQMCKDAIDDYKERTGKDCEAIAGVMSREIQSARNFAYSTFNRLIKSPSSNIVKNGYMKMLDNVTMQLSNGKYVGIILIPSETLK